MQTEKAERITITLPPDMLAAVKKQVSSASYGSTSEVIREAVRLLATKRRGATDEACFNP
jgi:antitoxin ParD1/3/4